VLRVQLALQGLRQQLLLEPFLQELQLLLTLVQVEQQYLTSRCRQVQLGQRGQLGQRAPQAHKVFKVYKVLWAQLDRKVQQGLRVQPALPVQPVRQEQLVQVLL
jgi:hypothetical protein